jgi:hypothetical protein
MFKYFTSVFIACLISYSISGMNLEPRSFNGNKLPDDALRSDMVVQMIFLNNENSYTRNQLMNQFIDSLLSFGFNIKYWYIPQRSGDPTGDNELLQKYKPKYIIKFLSTISGMGCTFSSNAKEGASFSMSYEMENTMMKLLKVIKLDVVDLKGRIRDANDDFSLVEISDSTKDKLEEFVLGPPVDLREHRLAVIMYDPASYSENPKVRKKAEFENKQIVEIMKNYPYSFEIIEFNEFLKDKNRFEYALYISSDKQFVRYEEKMGDSWVSRTGEVPQYSTYISKSSDPTKFYIEKSWTANHKLNAYRKFVKFINQNK